MATLEHKQFEIQYESMLKDMGLSSGSGTNQQNGGRGSSNTMTAQ